MAENCKNCVFFRPLSGVANGAKGCHYMLDTGEPRRCSAEKCDLVGYLQAIQDLLVTYKVLEDDSRDYVASTDGSRVMYDKENPRTEITITRLDNYEQWKSNIKSKKE